MYDLIQFLFSERPLWITPEGYRQLMMLAFAIQSDLQPTDKASIPSIKEFFLDPPTYQEESKKALSVLKKKIFQEDTTKSINITNEFDSSEIPQDSVAYHRVWGPILADSRWWASSKQLECDLLSAEHNPAISCHFLHINSPGGEAWYLDRLSETLQHCSKPVLTLYEGCCCSAAYHIGCHGNRVLATTQYDLAGSIGTMVSFHDFEPYYEKLGIKLIEARATQSDLKNKVTDDLRNGKPEEFINRVLNPMNEEFLTTVKAQRPALAQLGNDAPVLRGEIYFTQESIGLGLADGVSTFVDAVAEAYQMGRQYSEALKLKHNLYNL